MSGLSGINQLGELARAARLAERNLQPELRKRLNKLGPPAKRSVIAQVMAKMPKRGGYARTLAKAIRMSVRTDLGFTTAGVTLTTSAAGKAELRHIDAINKGILRHRVYGRRVWVTQRVPQRFWDDAMDEVAEMSHRHVREVLAETARTLKGRP